MLKNNCDAALPRILVFLLAMVLHIGCSEDMPDDPTPENPEVFFTAFGNTGTEEIQMDVDSRDGTPQIISLTEELGLVDLPFFRRDVDNASVAYYFWQDQRSSARYKDLDTGELSIVDDVCAFSTENIPERVIRRVSGNATYVVMPYATFPAGSPPGFAIRILDKGTGLCKELPITGINASGIENYTIQDNLLALYYLEDITGDPLITLIDLATGTIEETFILQENFQAATFRGPELWIFNQDDTYLIYNTQTGNIVRTGTAPALPAQGPGMFNSRFSGNRLLVRYVYQQPSLFFAQPAIYDFDQGALTEGSEPFLPELQERIEQETGDRALFGNFAVDLNTGVIALIYVRGNGAAEGGVVLTNFEREWLDILPLPYVPEQLEIRQVR